MPPGHAVHVYPSRSQAPGEVVRWEGKHGIVRAVKDSGRDKRAIKDSDRDKWVLHIQLLSCNLAPSRAPPLELIREWEHACWNAALH